MMTYLQQNIFYAVSGAAVSCGLLFFLIGFYTWYVVVALLALAAGLLADNFLYFYAFILGMMTAFTEIIGKFNDEPIKSLKTPHAVFYHLFNGLIAAFAVKVLIINTALPQQTEGDRLKIVLAAGLGSMAFIRAKLFNIKVAGEDVAFGPEQVIKVFFSFMQKAIDRVRAQSRVDFVKAKFRDIDFDMVHEYSLTMLGAAQALETKEKEDCIKAIEELKDGKHKDKAKQLKSYDLGFILLNTMGEDFVSKLFDNAPPEWKIRAPIPEKTQESFLDRLQVWKQDFLPYMAYGSSMSSKRFRDRLRWSDMEETHFSNITKPKRCVLKGYRLVFNKPIRDGDSEEGRANLVPDETQIVEGVLYQLPIDAIDFLDRTEPGYRREQVTVMVEDKSVKAHVYIAETTREGLKPEKEHLEQILDGAREHQLGSEYIQKLEKFAVLQEVPRQR